MKSLRKLTASLLLVVLMVFSFIPTINVGAYTQRNIYVLWNDDQGVFHKKLIENVDQNDGADLAYTYKSVEEIGDGFDLSYRYELMFKEDFDAIEATADFTAAQDKIEYLIDNQISLEPIRSIQTKTSVSHMGGMNFRFIAYAPGFIGLRLTTPEGGYQPDFIGGLFFEDHYDIGGTTKEKPAVVQSSLLNSTINIESTGPSSPYKSVKALDVDEKAVQVMEKGDGIFTIKFNSNYFDRVVFEVTTEDNQKGYVMIARDTLNIVADNNDIRATLYYTKDHSYKDYQVVANIVYNDGKEETKVLDAVKDAKHDTNEDRYEYETTGEAALEGNAKLKKCQFVVSNASKVKYVYFNVVKTGATSIIDAYQGTFAGSKSGIKFGQIAPQRRGIIYYEGMVA